VCSCIFGRAKASACQATSAGPCNTKRNIGWYFGFSEPGIRTSTNFVEGFKSRFTVNQDYPEFYLLKNKIDDYIILEQRETEFTLLIDSKHYTEIADELEKIKNIIKD
jgi:hypothetical protein